MTPDLAGGLSADERHTVEAHVNGCADCAQALADARKLEQTMDDVFAKDRPKAGLEEASAGQAASARFRRATLLRFVGAAAAVLVVGLLGTAMQAIAFSERPTPYYFRSVGPVTMAKVIDDTRAMDTENGTDYKNDRIEDASVPGSTNANEADLKSRTDPSDINNIAIRPTGKGAVRARPSICRPTRIALPSPTTYWRGDHSTPKANACECLPSIQVWRMRAPTWRGKTLRVRR